MSKPDEKVPQIVAVQSAAWWPEFLQVKDSQSWEALARRFDTPAHVLKRASKLAGVGKVKMPPGGRPLPTVAEGTGVEAPPAPAVAPPKAAPKAPSRAKAAAPPPPPPAPPTILSHDDLAANDKPVPPMSIDERIASMRELVGTMADSQVALLASVSPDDVSRWREENGIAAYGTPVAPPPVAAPARKKGGKPVSAPAAAPEPVVEAVAPAAPAVEPEDDRAEEPEVPEWGPLSVVTANGKRHGINRYGRRGHPLKKQTSLLGKVPDQEIADQTGVPVEEVERYRKRLRIAAFAVSGPKAGQASAAPVAVAPVQAVVTPIGHAAPVATEAGETQFAWRVLASQGGATSAFYVVAPSAAGAVLRAESSLAARGDGAWTVLGLRRSIEALV